MLLALVSSHALSLSPTSRGRAKSSVTGNNPDDSFPWSFTGRLWFRPALVRVSEKIKPPSSVSILSLFGWTVGGVVALEYDDSPVGPYREYVTMGAVVSKRGALGQWGSRLYVSTKAAEDVCRETWNVPAEQADIQFLEEGSSLRVTFPPDETKETPRISLAGWKNTRILDADDTAGPRSPPGGVPVLWTPSIKALWAPFVPFPSFQQGEELPLHRLRLSAGAIRLRMCGQEGSEPLGVPLGIGLAIDNVFIEIAPKSDDL